VVAEAVQSAERLVSSASEMRIRVDTAARLERVDLQAAAMIGCAPGKNLADGCLQVI
jgi:hypothetical protein